MEEDQNAAAREDEISRGGVIQLRYADEDDSVTSLSAGALVEALSGVVELTKELSKHEAFGDDFIPNIQVRPVREGSFILEIVVATEFLGDPAMQQAIAGGVVGATTTSAIHQAFNLIGRLGKGVTVASSRDLPDGRVELHYSDQTSQTVAAGVYETVREKPYQSKRAVQKILKPLAGKADRLQVRDGNLTESSNLIQQSPVEFEADLRDFRNFETLADDIEEHTFEFDTEVLLVGIDFRPGAQWRILATGEPARKATIEDEEFLREVDNGRPIHKGDILQVRISETVIIKNSNRRRHWSIVKVFRSLKGGRGKDDGTHDDEASEA